MTSSRVLPLAVASSAALLLAACNSGGNSNGGGTVPAGATVMADVSTTAANDLRGLSFGSDGLIYASGHTDADATDRQTVIMRFNTDGTPDTNWGGDGSVELNLAPNGGDEQSYGVVVLSNGDVIAVVNATDGNGGTPITSTPNATITANREDGQDVLLVKLDSTGSLVNSFGTNGVVEVAFGWADNTAWPTPTLSDAGEFSGPGFPSDTAFDLKLDTSGSEERVVVFGYGSPLAGSPQRFDNDRYVTRVLASSGAVDSGFNSGTAFSWASTGGTGDFGDNGRRGHVFDDGSMVSVGYTNYGDGFRHHVVLLKLTETGVLDPSFQGFGVTPFTSSPPENGVAVFNPFREDGGFAEAYAVGVQTDGSMVTTGYGGATGPGIPSSLGYETYQAQDLVSFRVPASGGGYDRTWGNFGTQAIQSEAVTGTPSFEERGRHVLGLPDDRTVHVGRFGGTAAIYVLTADGQLDTSVDQDGIFELPDANISAQFYAVAASADGSLVATTTNSDDNGARLVVIGFGS